jgi:energy-coupling factor transport system substrate-specific component
MRELISCWQHTRMIVLIAVTAALYVAVLLPFKIAVIVPGITEIRPGAAVPVFLSIFLGPAAAWGAAFGNTIGDVIGGTIGPGTLFGFFGNFLYGFVPYRIIKAYLNSSNQLGTFKGGVVFVFLTILASALCAMVVALGVDLIGFKFDIVVHAIFLNNVLMSLILVPLLIRGLGKRIRGMRLDYEQVLQSQDISSAGKTGPIIVLALTVVFYVAMMIPGVRESFPFLDDQKNIFQIGACVILFVAAMLLI